MDIKLTGDNLNTGIHNIMNTVNNSQQINKNEIYNMDCLEYLDLLDSNSIDCIILDPPYYNVVNEEWDKQWKSISEYNELEGRLCVVYYKQHIPYRIIEDSKYFEKRYLMLRKDYNKIELELNETKDEVEEYTEERRQLLRKIRVLNRDLTHEQNTNIQNEENLQKKKILL